MVLSQRLEAVGQANQAEELAVENSLIKMDSLKGVVSR